MMIAALTGVPRMAILAAMNSRPALAITFVAALLLAACAEKSLLVGYEENENFLIQTSRACSLEQCTTNFQCIDAADAAKYGR